MKLTTDQILTNSRKPFQTLEEDHGIQIPVQLRNRIAIMIRTVEQKYNIYCVDSNLVRDCCKNIKEATLVVARAAGFPAGRRLGVQLAITLVATINVIISFFSFLFSVVYFAHRRSARIK